ncbi:MAG: SDR family oxidoreductase [Rhodospirillales bacterium]|nr:SDR family oxidoreductase [Rhodospirillales bacterium]
MSVLVVTGASAGIGAATALLAAERGWDVAISYKANAAGAEQVAAGIRSHGRRALAMRADAADEAETVAFFARIDAELGPIRGLVNNAGITGPALRLDDVTGAMLAELFALNVTGTFLATREAIKRMATDRGGEGGVIVNLSSRAAAIGGAGTWVHYAASKGAIDSATLGAARELAPRGIRVNAVAPGPIETEIHAKAGLADRLAELAAVVPMGRSGSADEVARAILFLLSEESSYITGAVLPIGGGR